MPGDLNFNMLCNPPESHTRHLLDVFINFQFQQVLKEPIRVCNETKTLIDLVITNIVESLIHSGIYPLSRSNYDLIDAVRKIGIPREEPRFLIQEILGVSMKANSDAISKSRTGRLL